ncbi:MAG: ornithine cyclodeaminase family protein [Pseudomonadota bacterium]
MVLYLPDDALEAMEIAPPDIADAIEAALVDKAEGRLHVSPKSALLPGDGRYMMSTLAVGDVIVVKQVTVSPDNPAKNLPAINGAIMVLDAETGLLRAVLGANWITAHRTAALSAVAARRLADPGSSTIAFVGCGVQAQSHLHALNGPFPLTKALAVGRSQTTVDGFLDHVRSIGLDAEQASAEDALSTADIVVTSITLNYETKPFLSPSWLKPNAFAAITDLCIPWHNTEMDRFGTIVVDDLEQERTSEKPMVAPDRIAGDLTGLVTGAIDARVPGKPAAFAFRGIALGDYAAAALVLSRAEETGAGQRIG